MLMSNNNREKKDKSQNCRSLFSPSSQWSEMAAAAAAAAMARPRPRDEQARAQAGSLTALIVTPGDVITADAGFMRGHGTFVDGDSGELVACVPGVVETVNKLIRVRPLRTRYVGEIGDVVVGRITEVGKKRRTKEKKRRKERRKKIDLATDVFFLVARWRRSGGGWTRRAG
jgi:hypothetical protein